MKKSTKRLFRKLPVKRETLFELSQHSLSQAAGADSLWNCTTAPTCEMPTKIK